MSSNELSKAITACRSCGSRSLDLILDLGVQPPANSLRANLADRLPAVPLEICRCAQCATVQLTQTVSPEYLFQEYLWVTATSRTANEYSRVFCNELRARAGAAGRRLSVVEVASNDGTFLKQFQAAGDRVLGVDPARNIAEKANAAGIPTWPDFFNQATAKRIIAEQGPVDAAFARNVLPHVPDPLGILKGMRDCVKDDGIVAVEFHRADAILEELHYDSIYHEHLFYHSLASMEYLLKQAGLRAFDLMLSPISGGSFVAYCARQPREPSAALQARRKAEISAGTNTLAKWQDFAKRAHRHREALRKIVLEMIAAGKRMIGYGASARSSTLLNFCGINSQHMLAIADRSSYKHHLWTPGTDTKILPPEEALALKPDVILLLAWNFREEIMKELRDRGFKGTVILPLPGDPAVVRV